MNIVWDTKPDYNGEFVKHAWAEVSDDIGLRLLSIARMLKRGETTYNQHFGSLRFNFDTVICNHYTAELILDLLRAMGARK